MPMPDLSDAELAAVIAALKEKLDRDRYPRAPRLEPLRSALAKLDPASLPPGSITDFAKAIRELINTLEVVGQTFDKVSDLCGRRKARIVAGAMSELHGSKGDLGTYVQRVADGIGSPSDIAAIVHWLVSSTPRVEDNISHITNFRDQLREQLGLAAALKLNEIIDGATGKRAIQGSIAEIVELAELGAELRSRRHRRRSDQIQLAIQAKAKQIIIWISELKTQLIDLHRSYYSSS